MKNFLFLCFLSTILWSCARVGSPVGGKKDTLAPRFLHASIDSNRINVPLSTKELRLDFDKYILLKDITKNLSISPPIKKISKILPNNLANKYVLIQWEDTLKANTTYNFNFGNAIADNNEGNVLPYFNFAFSTGPHLDDLFVSGVVKDAVKIKQSKESKPIVVGLYPEKDTIDYKQKPYYITKADEDGYFELNYLSPGNYRIIAFEDDNTNSIYDAGKEKIGFLKEPIHIEKSISELQLFVYPSQKMVKLKEAKSELGGVLFLFEGQPNKVDIIPQSDKLKDFKLTHRPHSDSAMVWFDAKKLNLGITSPEPIKFSYQADALAKKEMSITYKFHAKEDLTLASEESVLSPEEDFVISANYWLHEIDTQKWSLKIDSLTSQPFTAQVSKENPYQIRIKSDFKTGKKYQLIIPKESVFSYFKSNSKSYLWDIKSEGVENFGQLKLTISPLPKSPFWVKLYNESDVEVYHQKSQTETIVFNHLKPGTYFAKIFVDENNNGIWDEADFAKQQYAETVKIFYKPILVKALWEIVENWDLNDARTLEIGTIKTEIPAKNSTNNSQSRPSSQESSRKDLQLK
jgi:uncharacterized protein (DUF2141 family)